MKFRLNRETRPSSFANGLKSKLADSTPRDSGAIESLCIGVPRGNINPRRGTVKADNRQVHHLTDSGRWFLVRQSDFSHFDCETECREDDGCITSNHSSTLRLTVPSHRQREDPEDKRETIACA